MAEVAGGPAAANAVVDPDAAHAFLGPYICRPGFRGQGIGLAQALIGGAAQALSLRRIAVGAPPQSRALLRALAAAGFAETFRIGRTVPRHTARARRQPAGGRHAGT